MAASYGSPRRVAALALAGAILAAGRAATAQPFPRRLAFRAEILFGHVVGAPQTDLYSAGAVASGRLGIALVEPVSLQLAITEGLFPSSVAPSSVLTSYAAGARVEPRTVGPEGRIFAELMGGLTVTGFERRFGFEAAIGWEIALSRYLFAGPVLRYGHIVQPDSEPAPEDARYLAGGVSIAFRPFPPPRARQATFLAITASNQSDEDYDGVPDGDDRCVDVVEDHDGFEDDDGCPDLDDDRDGIPDSEDRCPRAAETRNGFEDDDGCPDRPPASPVHIQFDSSRINLQQRVYFDVERVQVPASVHAILAELGSFLHAHPEIRRLRIEAHADDRGTRRHGFELSFRRAQNVVAFLIERGVEPERLEAVGFGDLRPLDLGHDEITRAGNRRVEFVIADGPAGTAPSPPPGVWTAPEANTPSGEVLP